LSYTPAQGNQKLKERPNQVNGELAKIRHADKKRFGQQTPRRWGWGTPLKKRTATRIKFSFLEYLKTRYAFVNT